MSGFVKFFTKKKNSNKENKENEASLKRVNFERASTRSEVGADAQQRERAMRAIPNPYSVWTEPKKTRGPSSCPGVVLDSTYYNDQRRSSVRPPKQERAGSVYGDISGLRQYRIDGPSPDGGGSSISGSRAHSRNSSHSHHGGHHRASRRYGGEQLSMIEERSERSDRSYRSQQLQQEQHQHVDWNRSSTRRPPPPSHRPSSQSQYDDYTSGDSDDYDDTVRRLEHKIAKLKDDKNRYRNALEHKKNDLEYAQFQLKQAEHQLEIQIDMSGKLESMLSKCNKQVKMLQDELMRERKETEMLSHRLSEMSTSATSNGAMERLVSSSETSLEMDEGETGREREEEDEGEEREEGNDEVRNFRASDSVTGTSTVGRGTGGGGSSSVPSAVSPPSETEEMELPRVRETPSPQFELRRSLSDMGPVTMFEGAREEMAEGGGGSWRKKDRRRSFVKRPLLAPSQESESSDGERILLMERQVRKKERGVVKYDPNRRAPVKEKVYRRYGKHEISALNGFGFLEQEITDVSGMLSSPSEGNY